MLCAFMLNHGEAKALITDREFSAVIKEAIAKSGRDLIVIDVDDPAYEGGELIGETDYESFLLEGEPDFDWRMPADEWDAIALCYTSGTTGDPKGVVTHHRGAYLNAVSNLLVWNTAAPPCLPVDSAHVSLQWLVLPLGYRCGDRNKCVPEGGKSRHNFLINQERAGGPPLRRAYSIEPAGQRPS